MTADEKKPHSAARDSPSPTPSNSTAPLLVSQDFNSSSDEGGTTSDWSSPSSNEDNGSDEEEEEEEGFDLLASQELRQLPSDSSTNSNHSSTAEVEEEPRMSLSFPDPINTTTTAAFSLPTTMDDSEEEVVTTSSSSSTRARSPFQKVCQDLDNSILIDGGGYSLLLDAPTKHPVGITSDSEAEAGEKEEETTSTPPPPPLLPPQLSSSRPSYSKSNTPTSSIVRVNKRSNSNHAVAAEEKIDKWRSTLTTSPRTQDSSNSIIISESIDFSSVNSSQTVVPLSNTPLARSLLSTTTTTSSASSVVVNSTTSSTLSNPTDEKKKGRNFDENHSRKALDRISGEQNGGEIKVWWWWWNRLMVGLTVLGVALAGVGTLRIWRNNQDLTRRILQQTDQENKNTCSRSIPLVQVVDHEVTEMESVVSVKVKPGATASPTNSFVDDNDSLPPSSSSLDTSAHSSPSLPTTIGPLTLATSSSPSSSSSSSLPPARIDAPPPPSLYMIDPPFSLISPSSSSSFERSTISIKEKMLNHAMRCRRGGVQQQQQQQQVESSIFDETIRLLQIGVGSSSSKVSKRGGIRKRIRTRKIEKNLKENLLQENEVEEEKKGIESRKKRVRRRRSRKPRTILKFRPYSTSSSSSSFEDCKAQERVVGIMGLEFKETLKGAMKYFRGLENKFEKEIKTLVHQAQQSLEKSSSSTLHHQKLRLYRSEKYPIVRDYYRSAKEQVKSTIGNKGKTIRQARKGIERVKDFNYKGKTQAMVALMKNQAQLMRKRSGTEIERAQLKKKWREVFTRGEKHVKRAARAVKKIEKKDYWQSKRQERSERRERRRREKAIKRG